jgi:tRNA(Glu) U13 pseudouridine synthase TruD
MKTDWNDKPIGMTSDITNTFHIRLRATKKLSQTEKQKTEKIITQLFDNGVPNIFGKQRFGIESRNPKLGKDILEGKLKIHEKFEAKFKLQAYASRLFNEYVAWRTKKEPKMLDGDILQMDETGQKKLFVYNQAKNTLQEIKARRTSNDAFCSPQTMGEPIPYTQESTAEIT